MKYGYHTLTWANHYDAYSLIEAMESVRKAGYRGIEFVEPLSRLGDSRVLAERLRERGLTLASLSCGLSMKESDEEDIRETCERVDFAAALGASDVMVCGGWLGGGIEKDDSAYRILASKLDTCIDRAEKNNMRICFHPHKNTIVETRDDIERLLSHVPRVSLCLDIAHLNACGSDPAECIRTFRRKITYLHLKDWDMVRDEFVELGKGEVDIPYCLRVLEEIGYDGWAVVELDRTQATPEKSAEISAEYLKKAGVLT